ncbi:NACHT domain-containing protein [Almyronema epifaneia]|uniref:NACHT domain-containing protein n=1 Tax=Almyronema epifaneia S1 TaxID=2991925 RepID=A0ABW6IJY2_9CYAN
MGKSQELENLQNLTEQKISREDQVLSLNLRSCTNLKDDLFKDEVFLDWLGNNYHLYLFLDSLDEGRLSVPTIATGLVDELQKKKYKDHLHCLHIRIACRTFVFSEISEVLETGLKELWQEAEVGIYELVPLRRVDVALAAREEGFSSDTFLKEIDQKNVVPLSIKPITLGFLLNTYRKHNGQFPADYKLFDFYLEGCKLLCEEVNPGRRASKQVGSLDADRRLVVAARIAAVTIFTNRFAVWTGVDQGNAPFEDVSLQELCIGYETAQERDFEIDRKVLEEVLDTGLFSSRGVSRMGWAHQTYAEFLAAWYLAHSKISATIINTLLFSSQEADRKLIPQLHETAAWLASMRPDILQEIIKTDPDVLLQTDVPTDAEVRAGIVDGLLTQCEQGKLFDSGRVNCRKYTKLKHPDLFDQLRPYICDSTKQLDVRDLAISIAEACEISELQKELANLAISPLEPIDLRTSAANALIWIGDIDTRLNLKPLIITPLPEDEYDQLRGKTLKALWPEGLDAHELFRALTPPKKRNYTGAYQIFANIELPQRLRPGDLLAALNWLKNKGHRIHSDPFESLCNQILLQAWENFSSPGVSESFAKVALLQWKSHEDLIPSYYALPSKAEIPFLSDEQKRLELIRKLVLVAALEELQDPCILVNSELTSKILVPEDICWLLQQLQDSENHEACLIWAPLVHWSFKKQQSGKYNSLILEVVHRNDALKRVFGFDLMPINLDSDWAQSLKEKYYASKGVEKNSSQLSVLSNLALQEKISELLNALENGDLNSWLTLNSEIINHSIRRTLDADWELNLTNFSAWQQLSNDLKVKILEGVKNYIKSQAKLDIEQSKLEDDCFKQSFCRALLLILELSPSSLKDLTSECWKSYTELIISVPGSHQHNENYLGLIEILYSNAPRESLDVLEELIHSENEQYKSLFSIYSFERCFGELLENTLLKKAIDRSLTPESVGRILSLLLEKGSVKSRDLAESLIKSLSSIDEIEVEKKLIISRTLMEHCDSSSWPFLWNLIQKDTGFGRSIIERFAYHGGLGMQFKVNLAESQLSEFYLWLVKQYPHQSDPDYGNAAIAHVITARECVADLRDSVLKELKERGSLQACSEIERLVKELPEIEWLSKTLVDAKANMRRKTWQPLVPEDFLELVISQEPSNLDLSDKLNVIDRRTQKMEKEPKVDKSIHFSNSNISGVVNTGDGKIENKSIPSPSSGKLDWKFWLSIGLTVLIGLGSVAASGVFNDEIRNFIFWENTPSPVEENSNSD